MNEDQVQCPHHGSVFDVTTGDVVRGLATECLPKYAIRVEGENVLVEVDGSSRVKTFKGGNHGGF